MEKARAVGPVAGQERQMFLIDGKAKSSAQWHSSSISSGRLSKYGSNIVNALQLQGITTRRDLVISRGG